jgi:hypothetical protein
MGTRLTDGNFQTKNFNLGKFWRALQLKMLVHFMAIWSILQPFGFFTAIWYFCGHLIYFSCFGMLDQEKSAGNPAWEQRTKNNF